MLLLANLIPISKKQMIFLIELAWNAFQSRMKRLNVRKNVGSERKEIQNRNQHFSGWSNKSCMHAFEMRIHIIRIIIGHTHTQIVMFFVVQFLCLLQWKSIVLPKVRIKAILNCDQFVLWLHHRIDRMHIVQKSFLYIENAYLSGVLRIWIYCVSYSHNKNAKWNQTRQKMNLIWIDLYVQKQKRQTHTK